MARIYLLPQEGSFYKANLHSHTTVSDGKMTPEESKQRHLEAGYSVVAYTDHEIYINHEELNDEKFVALAAYEIDINQWTDRVQRFAQKKTYHINFYDKAPWENAEEKKETLLPEQRYDDINYINSFIARMNARGFLSCYNHPYWSLQNYDDFKALRGLWAMEIYNHGCEVDGLYGYNPQSYDELLRTGARLYCVSTDDNHNWAPFGTLYCDSFGGFTMIKAPKLDYTSIIQAMEQGNFYSSMGPEIEQLYLEDGVLTVTCSPVEKIYVITQGRKCYYKMANPGETITQAQFKLDGTEGYIRVDCRDAKGLHANSNAYFIDQLGLMG